MPHLDSTATSEEQADIGKVLHHLVGKQYTGEDGREYEVTDAHILERGELIVESKEIN